MTIWAYFTVGPLVLNEMFAFADDDLSLTSAANDCFPPNVLFAIFY